MDTSIIVAIFGLLGVIAATLVPYWVTKIDKRLIKKYLETHDYIERYNLKVFLFGPRSSGKTSAALKMSKRWIDIGEVDPTLEKDNLKAILLNSHEEKQDKVEIENGLFKGNKRTITKQYIVELHDLAGDIGYQNDGIEEIEKMKKSVNVLLFFDIKFEGKTFDKKTVDRNKDYYTDRFIKKLKSINDEKMIEKVIIVTSKFDEGHTPKEMTMKELDNLFMQTYKEEITLLKRTFSPDIFRIIISSSKEETNLSELKNLITFKYLPKENTIDFEDVYRLK